MKKRKINLKPHLSDDNYTRIEAIVNDLNEKGAEVSPFDLINFSLTELSEKSLKSFKADKTQLGYLINSQMDNSELMDEVRKILMKKKEKGSKEPIKIENPH